MYGCKGVWRKQRASQRLRLSPLDLSSSHLGAIHANLMTPLSLPTHHGSCSGASWQKDTASYFQLQWQCNGDCEWEWGWIATFVWFPRLKLANKMQLHRKTQFQVSKSCTALKKLAMLRLVTFPHLVLRIKAARAERPKFSWATKRIIGTTTAAGAGRNKSRIWLPARKTRCRSDIPDNL